MDTDAFSTKIVISTDQRFLNADIPSDEVLKLVDVPLRWREWVRVLDKADNLILLHYITTLKSCEEPEVDDVVMSWVGHVRGIIVDTDTMKVVCRSFGYTPELVVTDSKFDKFVAGVDRWRFFYAEEGTIMRVFYHNNQWYVSTHRKINGLKSFWSGPTFGKMLDDVKQFEYDSLRKEYCYIMLLSHPENRIIYKLDAPQLLMVGIYDRTTSSFLDHDACDQYVPKGVLRPVDAPKISTVEDLARAVFELEEVKNFKKVGVIAFKDNKPVKIVPRNYQTIRRIRGNDPHLKMRYIDLRGSVEGDCLKRWFDEPKYTEMFARVEKEMEELARNLHRLYIERYVKKNFDTLPKEEFVFLQTCHSWHTGDRAHNIVTLDRISSILRSTSTKYVLRMLKRMKQTNKAIEKPSQFPRSMLLPPAGVYCVSPNSY
jgi:hypothetical protein